MIEQLDIHNFRGIKRGTLKRLRQFNLFVGPNNAGKSAMLESIYLAATANRPADLIVSSDDRVANYKVTLPAKDLLHQIPANHLAKRHNHTINEGNRFNQEILQVTISDEQIPIRSFDLVDDNNPFKEYEAHDINLFRVSKNFNNDTFRMDLDGLATDLVGQSVTVKENQELVFCWERELTYFYKGSASWLFKGKLPPARHVLYYDMFNVQDHIPETFYKEMVAAVPGWMQKVGQRFGKIFDITDPFNVMFLPISEKHAVQGWIAPQDNIAQPIDVWGDGARAAFKLLTPLTALAHLATPDRPATLLWEEPELFQNPQTLGKLLREVVDIVRDKPIQIFMVSHSLEVVAHLTQMLQDSSLPPDDTIAFLLNLQQGQLQSTWFNADNLLSWLETGLDPRVWDEFVPPVQFRLSSEDEV